jgi:hypothetical protein
MHPGWWLSGILWAASPAWGEDRISPRGFEVVGTVEIVEEEVFWVRDGYGNLFRLTLPDQPLETEMPDLGASVRVVAVNCGGEQLAERVEPAASR